MVKSHDLDAVPVLLVNDPASLQLLRSSLANSSRVAVDSETHKETIFPNGLWSKARVVSLAVRSTTGEVSSYVVDLRDMNIPAFALVMASIAKADAWNANFDESVLELAGIPIQSWWDAMLTDSIIHSGQQEFTFYHKLSWAALRYLGIEMTGKGTVQSSFDGKSDLTPEQIKYAAHDAIITLWVSEKLDEYAEAAGLTAVVKNEQAARPFVNAMFVHGFPFHNKEWKENYVDVQERLLNQALKDLASLSGGGAMTLFGEEEKPSWDPHSDDAVRKALNEHATDAVRGAFGRTLEKNDRVNSQALKQINHPLAVAMLQFREYFKTVSTYGKNLDKFIDEDSRIHSEYFQGGIVATGRLSSSEPNAQNLHPAMKTYVRPSPSKDGRERVFVHADLSQAEVRVIAQLGKEENLISLFKQGGDFHTLNAGSVFNLDMEKLKLEDPKKFAETRGAIKETSFGIPYGLGAHSLSMKLTVERKIPTSYQQAQSHIAAYLKTNPGVAGYLDARDEFINNLAANPPEVDWDASFRLYDVFSRVKKAKFSFSEINKREPSLLELATSLVSDSELSTKLARALKREPSLQEVEAERQKQIDEIRWALNFSAPVVLAADGEALAWESRTLSGRRRIFNVPMEQSPKKKDQVEGVINSVILTVCLTNQAKGAEVRDAFASVYNLDLPKGIDRCPMRNGENQHSYRQRQRAFRDNEQSSILKAFEGQNRWLKRELIKFVIEKMGKETVYKFLLKPALSEQIKSQANKYRNHPVQGLVAEIMFEAMAEMHEGLKDFEDAFPIQQVHDSIAIECFAEDGPTIALLLKAELEDAMTKWCPLVPAKADADVRTTLSDASVTYTVA